MEPVGHRRRATRFCGPISGSNEYADLYAELNQYVHTNFPGSLTIANPGQTVPSCYQNAADVLVTFEGPYSSYLNPTAEQTPASWQLTGDPNKFLNLVYDTPQADLASAENVSKEDNAGYVYFTDRTLDANPWLATPTASGYLAAELAATQVTDTQTPATPAAPTATSVAATSVGLSWASAASSAAAGYDVYANGTWLGSTASAAPSATAFTATGLKPGTQYTFTVRARDLAGTASAASVGTAVTTAAANSTPPNAPGSLTAGNLGPASVTLSWTTPSDTAGTLAYYYVYENGAKILTLDSSITGINLGDLAPQQTYSFDVVARDTTGAASAASTTLSVTTPATGGDISSPSVTESGGTVTFSAQYNLPYTFYNVLIDTDGNAATGYSVTGADGTTIGADYLIENGTLYSYVGPGFSWSAVSGVSPLVSNTNGLYVWQVPAADLGSGTTSLSVVFNGNGNSEAA